MINSSSTTVSAELGLRLVAAEQAVVPLVASLHYSGNDPYAIRMAFYVGSEDPVEWIFARDLLADGLMTPEGDGDVQIWPSGPAGGGGQQKPLRGAHNQTSCPLR